LKFDWLFYRHGKLIVSQCGYILYERNLTVPSKSPQIIDKEHKQRYAAEAFIEQRYRDCYGAHIGHFPARLITIFNCDGSISAACGLRDAAEGFISDGYLKADIADAVGHVLGRKTAADDLIEFTTLAADSLDHLMQVLNAARDTARHMGKRLAIFTTTELISRILRRHKVKSIWLAHADETLAPGDGPWGDYYGPDTNVYILPDEPTYAGNLFVAQSAAE
jgi:hypothetical protein